jgi:hypothetical protein
MHLMLGKDGQPKRFRLVRDNDIAHLSALPPRTPADNVASEQAPVRERGQ